MNITPLLIETLKFIQKYTMENTYPPALSDIMFHFEISKTPARNRLLRLEQAGLIRREPHKARAIGLTDEGIEAIAYSLLIPELQESFQGDLHFYPGLISGKDYYASWWLRALDDARHGNFTLEDNDVRDPQ